MIEWLLLVSMYVTEKNVFQYYQEERGEIHNLDIHVDAS